MFSKRATVDIKKSTIKIQDCRRDSATRLKHIKLVLEYVDKSEAKLLFETNFSHVYNIFYDNFIQTEINLKQRELSFHLVHKTHKEELEVSIWLLNKILTLLPELLEKRWQSHSLWQIFSKLLSFNNSFKLRKEAMRLFLVWYQCLGDNSPPTVHAMFASLVPNFACNAVKPANCATNSVFHDVNVQNPVTAMEITAILPPSNGEKTPDNQCVYFFELLLDYMVETCVTVQWSDVGKQEKAFEFLLDRFKSVYLPCVVSDFDYTMSIYNPNLELPLPRKTEPESDMVSCRVTLIGWITRYTHIAKKNNQRVANILPHQDKPNDLQQSLSESCVPSTATAPPTNDQLATKIVRHVFHNSRDNINFIHEMYRQAFHLNFNHSLAIRKVIAVYKDLFQTNLIETPCYALEPEPHAKDDESYKRLRNDSYIGAIHRENFLVRAGLQNILRVFMTHSARVFLMHSPSAHHAAILEEQTDICKRILNIYRYMVMHTLMDCHTWEQLLLILLQITAHVLTQTPPKQKTQTLGGKLAPAIFQTLIVTWIKANLNVYISKDLWDRFVNVLTTLTQWEELIVEWAKTMDTLTRVLTRNVYNLDLNDLPLDRLSEQKAKKNKMRAYARSATICESTPSATQIAVKNDEPRATHKSRRAMSRSYSETCLHVRHVTKTVVKTPTNVTSIPTLPRTIELQISRVSTVKRQMRKSASFDTIPSKRVTYDSDRSRSPSPTASSGLETNSIKDAPMDLLDVDGSTCAETTGVLCGGTVRGWLPDVAIVLWKRMLASLGNPNEFVDAQLHAMVFNYLVKLNDTLIKVAKNQGVSIDNQSTPTPPTLVPPLTLIIPWCLQAVNLPDKYKNGRLLAYRLLAVSTIHCTDAFRTHTTHWFRELHRGLNGDADTINTIVRYLGARFLSMNVPGQTLLLLDLIGACTSILNTYEIDSKAPRAEAVAIIGNLLSLPSSIATLPMLQPGGASMSVMSCPDLKENVIGILLRVARREPTARARCIALSALGMFVYRELVMNSNHAKVTEAISVLLLALKFNNKLIAQVASDALLLLCDQARTLSRMFANVCDQIVLTLATTLSHLMPSKRSSLPLSHYDKSLLTSLLLCLGEWCMRLGPKRLLQPSVTESNLLTCVFRVLSEIIADDTRADQGLTQPNFHDDFDPNILIDNVTTNVSSSSNAQSNYAAVKLCAKLVLRHLVTHLGHFPMAIGAGRLSSLVTEMDDLSDANNLTMQVFDVPDVQFFILNKNTLASFVELPTLVLPGGGATAGLITADKQVRIILRDLSGKSCWDASILYRSPEHTFTLMPTVPSVTFDVTKTITSDVTNLTVDDSIFMPAGHINQTQPRALRHRPADVLPDALNAALDLDQLDDLLQYLGFKSPECVQNECPLNEPSVAPFAARVEADIMQSIVHQRNIENERATPVTSTAPSTAQPSLIAAKPIQFQHCRLLFSQLGLTGWDARKKCYLLARNEKLLRELRNVDAQRCRQTHKIAVIYVAAGQEDKNSILSNSCGSHAYERFVSNLAWEVELEHHTGFMGGLQKQGTNGQTAPYYATSFVEVIFHVATRMPSDNHEAVLNKTRHLGNDEVHIVWSEHSRDYRRGIIPTEFCDVLIVIYPLENGLCRVTINRKADIPYFGLLYDECIVETSVLAGLVRSTTLSASRSKRTILPIYQQFYEERAKSMDTIVERYKERTTYEEFAARVFAPIASVDACAQNVVDSSYSFFELPTTPTSSSTLAAALLDQANPPRMTMRLRTEHNIQVKISEHSKNLWINTSRDDEDAPTHTYHGISPKPFKKLSNTFKNVQNKKSKGDEHATNATETSPVAAPRKFKHT